MYLERSDFDVRRQICRIQATWLEIHLIVFVDSYSFFVAVRFLRTKQPSEVLQAFQSFVDEYDSYFKNGVERWHT